MEIQRIEKGIKNLNENKKNSFKNVNGFASLWNWFCNISLVNYIGKSMKENFYFLTISLVVLCVTIIASQLNPDDNIIKK